MPLIRRFVIVRPDRSICAHAHSDKKRTEQLLLDFTALNTRIHQDIELLLLSSTFGSRLSNLQDLEENNDSKELGFDMDARMRIMAVNEDSVAHLDLEIPSEQLSTILYEAEVAGGITVCQIGSQNVAVEYKRSHIRVSSQKLVEQRVRQLVALLNQPKSPSFRVLQCRGFTKMATGNLFAFVYSIPENFNPSPISLLSELEKMASRPSLAQKYRFALALSSSIAQLHMVQWNKLNSYPKKVHKSFRSRNIVFFKEKYSPTTTPTEFDKPWVFGFEYSRPERDFSAGIASDSLENDIYRHPERQGEPTTPFSKIHDIYALGVVLLEIGIWCPAIELEKNRFAGITQPLGFQLQLQKHASRRLKDKVGDKYTALVLKCLSGDFGITDDSKDDLKLQKAFREQVVSVLEKATQVL